MTFLRLMIPVALLVISATSASAQYTKYADLRQDNPIINDVIGELSSSDLHGTFNRISALFTRGQVRDLPAGTLDTDLPENVQRNLRNALEDLGEDLLAADDDLAASGLVGDELLRRQWVLVQLVDLVFADRMLELSVVSNASGYPITCDTSVPDVQCPYDPPGGPSTVTTTLEVFHDELIREPGPSFAALPLKDWLTAVLDSAIVEDGFGEFTSNGNMNPRNFSDRVQSLQTTAPLLVDNFLVHGEPIIDD